MIPDEELKLMWRAVHIVSEAGDAAPPEQRILATYVLRLLQERDSLHTKEKASAGLLLVYDEKLENLATAAGVALSVLEGPGADDPAIEEELRQFVIEDLRDALAKVNADDDEENDES